MQKHTSKEEIKDMKVIIMLLEQALYIDLLKLEGDLQTPKGITL